MGDSALQAAKNLFQLGVEQDWKADLVGTIDDRILIIREDTTVVIGEVLADSSVLMFSTPQDLSDFQLREE